MLLPLIALVTIGPAVISAVTYAINESSSGGGSSAPGSTTAEAQEKARAKERQAKLDVLLQRYGITDPVHKKAVEQSLNHANPGTTQLAKPIKKALSNSAWAQKENARLNRLNAQQRSLKALQKKVAQL